MVSIYVILPAISAALLFLLGAFILLRSRKVVAHVLFSLVALSASFWLSCYSMMYLSADPERSLEWARLGYNGVFLLTAFFYHFTVSFLRITRRLRTLILVYSLTFLFMLLNRTPFFLESIYQHFFWGNYPKAGILYPLFIIFFYAIFIRCLVLFHRSLKNHEELSAIAQKRIRYVLLAFSIAAFFGSSDFIANFGVEMYPAGHIGTLFFTFLFAYSIVRFRFLDTEIIFRKTMVYSLAAGLLTGLFIILVLMLTKLFADFAGFSSFKISVFAALVIALLFAPLKNRIQHLLDRLFYKTTYDYYAVVEHLSRELSTTIEIHAIHRTVVSTVFSAFGAKSVHLLSEDSGSFGLSAFRLAKDEGAPGVNGKSISIPAIAELPRFLSSSKKVAIKEELPRTLELVRAERLIDELAPFGGEVAVPVFVDHRLAAILILGEKLSGDIFTDEDITLLTTVANQTAIAVKNAALYAEKMHSERLASIGMMAATLAHEIKNPLASIKVFTQLLPEKYFDPEFRETFSKIVTGEIQRIDGLISELLDFSKKTPIKVERVNARTLLDETLALLSQQFLASNVEILKNYLAAGNIAGDAERLKQALLNILINSHQAMEPNGTLEVELDTEGSAVVIAITDSGKGIPKDIIGKIFDPFFTTKQRGAGLGLAITKKIIEDHGGSIRVESGLNRGTRFALTLPAYQETLPEKAHGTYISLDQSR